MRKINLKSVQLMGILNLTPDSFSDGGQIQSITDFLQKAETMLTQGAQILDLGAEASGPSSIDVSAEQELQRLLPYLQALQNLKKTYQFKISIDTYKSSVATEALKIGADIINDITAFRGDPNLASALASSDCQIVLMYSKDTSARTTKTEVDYPNIMTTLIDFFTERIAYASSQGIQTDRLILDPGMGAFVSTDPTYSYQILENLNELKTHFELPILIGTSRKSMHPQPLKDRLIPSVITAMLGAVNGADILRVHDVLEHKLALQTLSW